MKQFSYIEDQGQTGVVLCFQNIPYKILKNNRGQHNLESWLLPPFSL